MWKSENGTDIKFNELYLYDHRNRAHDATLSFEGDAPTGSATNTVNNIVKATNMSSKNF